MKPIPETEEEILREIRVGDVVSVLLHPAGPGTEEYRRTHGHECDLKITKIDEKDRYFEGEYFIEDLEALFAYITMMDGSNDGSQVGDTRLLPEIPVYCIEGVVEKAPLTIDDSIEDAASDLAEAVARRRFGGVLGSDEADEWTEFLSGVQLAACDLAREFLTR